MIYSLLQDMYSFLFWLKYVQSTGANSQESIYFCVLGEWHMEVVKMVNYIIQFYR